MAYNVDPKLIDAIKTRAPADLQPVLLATALVESGGRTTAVGDGGHSIGALQEHDKGRGAGLTVAQRQDPYGQVTRAVREFRQYQAKGFSGGTLAARAQRPAAQGVYAQKVQSHLAEARRILGGAATPAQRQNLNTALPSGQKTQQAAPTIGAAPQDDTFGDNLVSGLMGSHGSGRMARTVASAIIDSIGSTVGQAATSQARGVKANPTGNNVVPSGEEPSGGGLGDRAFAAAKRRLGTPYSWGGGGPSGPYKGTGRGANTVGFDCSSLMQYAWAKVGVQLPRTTYGQIKVGRAVPANNQSQWRVGDLMFPSTGHVQMYVGNGKVIEAPRTGGHVQIVPVRSSYIAVRRPRG